MKNSVTYFLFLIFSLALSCEALNYFSKTNNVYSVDIDTKGEAEKSDENDEKADVFYYLTSCKNELTIPASVLLKNIQSSITFITSDYSTIVYSPPEHTL